MICTFAGHHQIFEKDLLRPLLSSCLQELIAAQGVHTFLCGGMGDFDRMAAYTLHQFKKEYPYIRSYLVIPYRTIQLPEIAPLCDEILFPEPLWTAHPKAAISKRNRWMVDRSEHLVTFVRYTTGGTYQTLQYASRKGGLQIHDLSALL